MVAAMMGEAAESYTSYAAYLAMERDSNLRYQWLDGQVFAMAGGTIAHGLLGAAVIAELRGLASRCGCVVGSSDLKLRVRATGLATYADGVVICGRAEVDPDDHNAVNNPSVLVEVLSDGTEGYDRGEKFEHYQRIEALREYVLVSQRKRRIEVYTRAEGGSWTLTAAGAGERVVIASLGGSLAVDRVYDGVELTATGQLRAL